MAKDIAAGYIYVKFCFVLIAFYVGSTTKYCWGFNVLPYIGMEKFLD